MSVAATPVTIPLRTGTLSAFGALLRRDLVVLRKNLKEFIPRTILQPLLLVFVFTYVFPKIGQGVGGSGDGADTFSSVLVAGVVATAILFQGIQAVALPLVQEFSYTREIEDRVLAPLPVSLVAFEKIVAGALQCLFAAAIVFPIVMLVPEHAGAPRRALAGPRDDPPALVHAGRRAGANDRHRVEPCQVSLMFSIVVMPMSLLGAVYYSWSWLGPVSVLRLGLSW